MPTEPRRQQVTAPGEGADEPFVGRRRELKTLVLSLEAARSGSGRLDVVTGVPGIGKTRLAREVAAVACRRGLRVLRGGCWEGEGAPAYWPWTDVLRSALDAAADNRAATAADFSVLLEAAAKRAGVSLGSPVDVSQDAQQARFVLFNRFCEFLVATAAAQPTLVILDDVHWADAGSLLLLQFLAGRLADLRLALLITSREPLTDMAASAARHPWARLHFLGGLSRAEAGALIETRIARAPAPEVLDRLMRLTEGNPYFLKELGQLLTDGEPEFAPRGGVVLPASLLVVALQQYHRLSPACRTALRAAAVIGQEFDAELVAAVLATTAGDIVAALDEAVERHIVIGLGAARYRFGHALLREAIHEQLHLSDRAHLHEQIAFALERGLAAGQRISSATLAHHFYMGLPFTDRQHAAAHAIAAGQESHRACAFEDAVFHLRRAQELCGPSCSDTEACDLLLHLGAAEAGAGDWARSRRTFADAAALARRIDSPERLARAALGFKGLMLGTIPVDTEAVALLQEVQSLLGANHPSISVELYAALSLALYFSEDPQPVYHYSDLAMDLARSLNSDRLTAVALCARTMANLRPHGVASVTRDAEDLLHLGLRLHDPMISFQARISRHWLLLAQGNGLQATQELSRATELAAKTRHPRPLWQVALLEASQALARGQLSRATQLIDHARDLGRRVHDSSPDQHYRIQTFHKARLTKDFSSWLTSSLPLADLYQTSVGYTAAQALIYAELGRHLECRSALQTLASDGFRRVPVDGYYLYTLACLAEAASASDCTDSAQALYSLLEPHRSSSIVAGWGTIFDGSVSHYLGVLACRLGHLGLSREHFEAALRAHSTLDAPPLLARTQLEYARVLALEPTHEAQLASYDLASAASRIFRELGLESYRAASEQVSANARHHIALTHPTTEPGNSISHSTNTFVRNGDLWTLRFEGSEVHLRHRVGLHYIALLIRAAGEPVHVLDLVSPFRLQNSLPGSYGSDSADLRAKDTYKRRLKSIREELALATRHNDLGRIDSLQQEQAALVQELAHSYGLSGRPRPAHSPAERARISVKNRISSALAAIRPYHQAAFQHLTRSLVTGTYCRYCPSRSTKWDL